MGKTKCSNDYTEQVTAIIKVAVEEHGVNGFARLSGLSPALISRYMNGKIGEPMIDTMKKLANYTGKTLKIEVPPDSP